MRLTKAANARRAECERKREQGAENGCQNDIVFAFVNILLDVI